MGFKQGLRKVKSSIKNLGKKKEQEDDNDGGVQHGEGPPAVIEPAPGEPADPAAPEAAVPAPPAAAPPDAGSFWLNWKTYFYFFSWVNIFTFIHVFYCFLLGTTELSPYFGIATAAGTFLAAYLGLTAKRSGWHLGHLYSYVMPRGQPEAMATILCIANLIALVEIWMLVGEA